MPGTRTREDSLDPETSATPQAGSTGQAPACGPLVYMGAMYVLAIVICGGARIIRNRQGIDLGLINKEIPVE